MTTTYVPAIRSIPANSRTAKMLHWLPIVVVALCVLAMLLFPDLAFAQDARQKIGESARKAFDLVFTVVYWICGIAVVVSGLAATFGRMEWGRFGQIVAGIVVVFSATMIVDYFK